MSTKGNNMKLKVNWKEVMKQLWTAIKPVLLGAIGGGIVGVASGCSSRTGAITLSTGLRTWRFPNFFATGGTTPRRAQFTHWRHEKSHLS
jgi:hypothetical protein